MTSKSKIGICTLYTENIKNYSDLTSKINQKYADKWGYEYVVFTERFSNDRSPTWDKILALITMMKTNKYDYILWIDSDAYINDFERRIENAFHIEENKSADIIMSSDSPYGKYTVNGGVILIKNTEWCEKMLYNVWDNAGDLLYIFPHEQGVISNFYDENKMDTKKHMKIFPSNDINNSNPNNKKCFICHMMGQPSEYRIQNAKNKLSQLESLY